MSWCSCAGIYAALASFYTSRGAPQEALHWQVAAAEVARPGYPANRLKLAKASTQPEARRWEAALRNNRGVALNQLKRHDEALAELRIALQLTEADGTDTRIRVAHWMVANTLRLMGRLDEARDIQLRLEREWDADKQPDPYVFEELAAIYKAQGNAERAAHYAARLKATEDKK